jgi:hypothetical protein
MEGLSKFEYFDGVEDVEGDVTTTIMHTISQGINDGGVLSFRIPGDSERFTDLNTILLRLELRLENSDGTVLEEADKVCLDAGGMHSLFSSCDVRFNEKVVSNMVAYPYSTALSRYLGCSKKLRDGVWDTLDATWDWRGLKKSDCSAAAFPERLERLKARVNGKSTVIGRIFSDVLMSSRQYLPPGVTLGIDLRRAAENFSIVSNQTVRTYKVHIVSASVYLRRISLRPSLSSRVQESARKKGCLTFTRLDTHIMNVASGTTVFRWLNCLNSAPLPNRMYIGFVSAKGFYGNLTQYSTYFENLRMTSLNVKLDGHDLLVHPIKTVFAKEQGETSLDGSNGIEGFLTIAEATNQVSDLTIALRMNYTDYMCGSTFFAVELGKAGGMSGGSGSLDLEFTFGSGGTDQDACVFVFTEGTESARF